MARSSSAKGKRDSIKEARMIFVDPWDISIQKQNNCLVELKDMHHEIFLLTVSCLSKNTPLDIINFMLKKDRKSLLLPVFLVNQALTT